MPKKKGSKAGGGGGGGGAGGGKKNDADAAPKEESAPALNPEESVPITAGDSKADTAPVAQPGAKEDGESCAPAAGTGDEDAAEVSTKVDAKSSAAAKTPEQEVVKEALPTAAKEEEAKDGGMPPRAGTKEGDGAAPESDDDKRAGGTQDASKSSASDGAGQPYPSGKVLRNDEECFLADYTVAASDAGEAKVVMLGEPVVAWIARELVELDEDVSLAIRAGPGKEEEEVGVLTATGNVIVLGTKGTWAVLEGDPARYVMAYGSDGTPLLKQKPRAITAATATKLVGSLASSAWGFLSNLADDGDSPPQPTQPVEPSQPTQAAADKPSDAAPKSSGWSVGGGGGGWGFGGMLSTMSQGAASIATNVATSVLKAGADGDGGLSQDEGGGAAKFPRGAEGGDAGAGAQGGAGEVSGGGGRKAVDQGGKVSVDEVGSKIAEEIDERFGKDVEMEEGGMSSVRMVSQGISMLENSLGWMKTTASATVQKIDQKKVDALVDQAWSGVKEGVSVSSKTLSTATQVAQTTASGIKDTIHSGTKLVSTALATDRSKCEAQRPNLKLGGALGIQMSGALLPRVPMPDEDSDPLLIEELESLKPLPHALQAIAALVEERFQEDVFLIAVASAGVQARMLRWLAIHNVYEQTGLARDRVHLCREEDELVDVCRELGVSHMIEVSNEGAEVLKSAVGEVLVIGEGAVCPILEGSEKDMGEKHSEEFEAWWGSIQKSLLPLAVDSATGAEDDADPDEASSRE